MPVRLDGNDMVLRKFELFIKAITAKALKGDMRAAKFLEKYIPDKSSETMAPKIVINSPLGCTHKDCPDFDPESIPPPIYGDEE